MHHRTDASVVRSYLAKGLSSFAVPEPMTLAEWAAKNFYLSAESSYVEQRWEAWPFQRAIMACISNDDIREVDLKKSARVGYTKIILAAVGYFAEHKRRNQALWQPTDDDRDEFVKTELDPMLRDVAVMRKVFPSYLARHKDNTLLQKKFLGSLLHLRGGKAAKNYRRISVDTAYLDEISAFDSDIDKEGDARSLAAKRVEGATFPKLVCGSTPKLRGFCQIDARHQAAKVRYAYHIPCPHCDDHHALTWGGKDQGHGFKWAEGDPSSVRHLCPHCGVLITQAEYLAVAERGFWYGDDKSTIDHHGVFRNEAGEIVDPPDHISFHVWTAYSPRPAWSVLVAEFLAAFRKAQEGDDSALKAFWNTTLGETWEGEIERTEAQELQQRAEPFPLQVVPRGGLLLLAGADTQDNRVEVSVWAYGRGGELWTVDHKVLFGNPAQQELWDRVGAFLFETEYPHDAGPPMRIYATAIDSGGHHSHAVYEFARKHAGRRVFAVRGRPSGEKSIKDGATAVDIDWNGKRVKKGVVLWHVGTNLAKDLLYGRMSVATPGPGYVHYSNQLSLEWFQQFTGEARAVRKTLTGNQTRWTAERKRVETWDCATYMVWLEHHLELQRKSDAWWDALEAKVQPAQHDLFASPASTVAAAPGVQQEDDPPPPRAPPLVPAAVVAQQKRPARRASQSTHLSRRR
ncbi:Bacteriophage tail assembly protein [Bordetella ansorpii]|uniref:Bacteriophage tail assembly protein n=1 Tax=Bordetella ansorpii TaxID=288768 RepID=A0A157RM39_9BORD|nr:terminase gpA endonuclease subunit [Bordetella ansorpii]SAI58954.1 Bacteriophage tail assembly protein [Bordetella ansorpii]